MAEIDKLEEIAKAATPGPWHVDQDRRPGMAWNRSIADASGNSWVCILTHSGGKDTPRDKATAEHIAAFNPERVLALLAVVRAAKELSAVSGLRVEYMEDELDALNAALAAFDALENK